MVQSYPTQRRLNGIKEFGFPNEAERHQPEATLNCGASKLIVDQRSGAGPAQNRQARGQQAPAQNRVE
jgi:hypothetical protein